MKGDFTGFTFAGEHTSDLNIVRVSDGDRYDTPLLPEFEEKVVDIPGNNGRYYFGGDYRQKNFTIKIAYDSLTEEDIVKLTYLFSLRELQPLIFDEVPYKTYMVKVGETPEFNYICFDEEDLTKPEKTGIIKKSEEFPVLYAGNPDRPEETRASTRPGTKRIYKGEGTINFIAYYLYGRCSGDKRSITYYTDELYPNRDEWAAAAGLIDLTQVYPTEEEDPAKQQYVDVYKNGSFLVYNPGQVDAEPLIYIPFNEGEIQPVSISLKNGDDIYEDSQLNLKKIEKKGENDTGIIINSHNHLIEGVIKDGDNYTITPYIYNEYIENGDFIKIPVHRGPVFDKTNMAKIYVNSSSITSGYEPTIRYDYLYY